ncbi:MAG: DUF6231 family protein [Cellvibrionaceae bacterium]
MSLTHSIEAHLLFQLEIFHPSSIIFLSDTPPPSALQKWAEINTCQMTILDHHQPLPNNLQPHDLAILFNNLHHLDKQTGLQLLGQLRNLYSHKIWVAIPSDSDYQFNDFIQLGFHQLTEKNPSSHNDNSLNSLSDIDLNYYGYDLAKYNHQRSWNNPKYWANPENWHKYRW